MEARSLAAAMVAATLFALPASARADDETVAPAAPVEPTPAEPDLEGPPRPPPDAPLPPEPPDEVTPRPTEAPVEPEPEPVPPRFGAPGVVVLTADAGLSLSYVTYTGPSEAERFSVSFQPGFDVFVVRNLSLGASLYAQRYFSRGYGANGLYDYEYTSIGAGPRIGYAIPLGRWLSLYPRINFNVNYVSSAEKPVPGRVTESFAPSGTNGNRVDPYLYVFVPLLIHPTSSFFIGAGPSYFQDIGGKRGNVDLDERSSFGMRMIVGGYFGGTPVPHDRTSMPPLSREPKRYHFGQKGDLLLGADFNIGAGYDRYAHTKRTVTSFSVSPAFDYFVDEHFSVGLGVGVGGSKATTVGPQNTEQTLSSTNSASVDARLGVQAYLTPRLSLYPRASLRVSYQDITTDNDNRGVSRDETAIIATLYLPLVVHFAQHFFAGWGPYVSRDLARYYDGPTSEVRATYVGFSTLVGGWL